MNEFDRNREMLELAAKAAGLINPVWAQAVFGNWGIFHENGDGCAFWDPLDDDGDSFRLAVKLCLQVFSDDMPGCKTATVQSNDDKIICSEKWGHDPCEAVRLAIVRCAAVIGKDMP